MKLFQNNHAVVSTFSHGHVVYGMECPIKHGSQFEFEIIHIFFLNIFFSLIPTLPTLVRTIFMFK